MNIQNQLPESQAESQTTLKHPVLFQFEFTLALLLIGLYLYPFETVNANPIWPYPDTFEIIWTSDVTQPEKLHLQCFSSSGQIEYTNTITCKVSSCTGSLCAGKSYCFEAFSITGEDVSGCDLFFSYLGTDYVVKYVEHLPVNCNSWGTEDEGVNTGYLQCDWSFDLSDGRIWKKSAATWLPPKTPTPTPKSAPVRVPTPTSAPVRVPTPTSALVRVPTTTLAVIKGRGDRPISGIQLAWLRFLLALLLAWLVEIPVLLILTRVLFRQRAFSARRVILLGLLMTLVTLPILWYVLPNLLRPNLYVVVGESLVILAEAAILKFGLKIDFARALLMSLAANVASFVAGFLQL